MTSNRRTFLKAAGVTLALPWLERFAPARAAGADAGPPQRVVFLCAPLGLHPPYFFPKEAGPDYTATPYLEPLTDLRRDFTVISGLAHPDVGPSHDSIFSFLTAAPHPVLRAGFRNSISVDQLAAEHIGGKTRFPSLALSAEGFGLSWTRSGALVPPDLYPASVFARLFLEGRPDEVRDQTRRLADGRSILDAVSDQAKAMQPRLGSADRDKLDEYFTSVRELEGRLARSQEWSKKPKPKVDAKQPQNVTNPADLVAKTRTMFDLIHLALQTDSTRLVTMLMLGTSLVPPIAGVTFGHHDLSHHGQDPVKIAQLRTVELEKMKALADFLKKLKGTREEGSNLLERTAVFFSSNLGNASTHAVKNLPVLLAGGSFRHGRYLAFDPKSPPPLSNLFLSMIQWLGVPADRFGSSTSTLTGLG